MSLLIVGSIAYDTVKTPMGYNKRGVGGSAIYSSLSASFFTKVKLIGVIGKDFNETLLKTLNSKGISTEGVKKENGKTFFWEGEYFEDFKKRKTLTTVLGVYEKFMPQIPKEYKKCKYVFLANIDPLVQLEILSSLNEIKFSACDTMNCWIEKSSKEVKKVIKKTDLVTINDEEAQQLTGENNLLNASKQILKMGTKFVIIKKGENGVLFRSKDDLFILPAYPVQKLVDPTGAGDSFAGGFCGYISKKKVINKKVIREAIAMGTSVASFSIEDFSIKKLLSINLKNILLRYKELKNFTNF